MSSSFETIHLPVRNHNSPNLCHSCSDRIYGGLKVPTFSYPKYYLQSILGK